MQSSSTYPLSTISTLKSTDQHHVDDDIHLSRITSNDSGISYDDSDDNESLSSTDTEFYDFDSSGSTITITEDGIKYLLFQIIVFFHFSSSSTSSNHS